MYLLLPGKVIVIATRKGLKKVNKLIPIPPVRIVKFLLTFLAISAYTSTQV